MVNSAKVGCLRWEVGIGVVRLPWEILASGISESEEESLTASSYPSSTPSCNSQLFARRSDLIDFPWSKRLSMDIKFFHLVLAMRLMDGCIVIRRFQIIFSIEETKVNLVSSYDMATNLDYTVCTSVSTSQCDLWSLLYNK